MLYYRYMNNGLQNVKLIYRNLGYFLAKALRK